MTPVEPTFEAAIRIPAARPYAYLEPKVSGTIKEIVATYLAFCKELDLQEKSEPAF